MRQLSTQLCYLRLLSQMQLMDDNCEGSGTRGTCKRAAPRLSQGYQYTTTPFPFLKSAVSVLPAVHIRFIRMADGAHTDTLAPPRKSVELEDPGAHELCEDTLPSLLCLLFASEESNVIFSLWR